MIVGREVTCGVGRIKGTVRAFAVTEIVSMREFYDYKSKYTDGQHDLITPADIPDTIRDLIFHYSEMLFRELACGGIVRADFSVTPEGVPYFLEALFQCQLTVQHFYLVAVEGNAVFDRALRH